MGQWRDMQAGSQAHGMLWALLDYEEAATLYAEAGSATLVPPLSVDAH